MRWVDLLGPAARGLEDLAGEHREGDRERDRRWRVPGRGSGASSAFPAHPRSRGRGVRQPAQRDVVEDPALGQAARGLPVDEGAGDLLVAVGVVVEHPGRQTGRRIRQGETDRLRRLALVPATAGPPHSGGCLQSRSSPPPQRVVYQMTLAPLPFSGITPVALSEAREAVLAASGAAATAQGCPDRPDDRAEAHRPVAAQPCSREPG
jgi:hypothetical protein